MNEQTPEAPIAFVTTDKVRYNEVDMHGGVNNPIYLAWAQDNRLEYLRTKGVDANVYMPVVMEAHIVYQNFLTANDHYRIDMRVSRDRLNHRFVADIVHTATEKVSAVIDQRIVFFKDRKPCRENILGL